MSPAKIAKKSSQKALTIEFSGVTTLVWEPKAAVAEVRLVDLGSAGFQEHYAAVGMTVTEDTAGTVKGPNADASVSLPGIDTDLGLWNLMGSDVEILGASGKLTVDQTPVDVTKKPTKTAESICWLADIGRLTEAVTLNPACPTAATVRIPAGRITASAAAGISKVQFLEQGTPVGPARYVVARFKAVIPFDKELAVRLDRRRVFRFAESRSIVISNTCVCGLGASEMPNHFYAHYDVTEAKRRPRIEPAGPRPMTPEYWPLCISGVVVR